MILIGFYIQMRLRQEKAALHREPTVEPPTAAPACASTQPGLAVFMFYH